MTASQSTGRVAQISISPGGVPKLPVPAATVGPLGLVGDGHRNHRHHGGPTRAVCLFSLEQIRALQAEGHPIAPGVTGENLTTEGIDLGALHPGDRLAIGETVVLEITTEAIPCANLTPYFADGRVGRVSGKAHPGWSRLYAGVVSGGELVVGQPILVLRSEG